MSGDTTLFLSVKPEYAIKLISGEKKVELRRTQPKLAPGDRILIYATSPLKKVIGYCFVKYLHIDTPDAIWSQVGSATCVQRDKFDEYFSGATFAVGIEIEKPHKLEVSLTLSDLQSQCPSFVVPQSYRYIKYLEVHLKKYIEYSLSDAVAQLS